MYDSDEREGAPLKLEEKRGRRKGNEGVDEVVISGMDTLPRKRKRKKKRRSKEGHRRLYK